MLTPVDIDNKTFKKAKIGGYDIADVEDFLVKVMEDYEALYKENSALKEKIYSIEDSVSHYKSIEEGINRTVENAQTSADEIKEAALKEAESIKRQAEIEAKDSLEDLKIQIAKKEFELEEKKKQMHIYRIKVSSMLEAQLKILNDDDME
ncbi:MAG: DivIVA domain-containing protein [Clostridia bacterium]|nr:DivIVA domain-containing protein [Clostridia bacterium]